jgi:predicted lipoprotein with Yx(FWY)xxD motif
LTRRPATTHRIPRLGSVAAAVSLLVVAAAGCGGGDSSKATAGRTSRAATVVDTAQVGELGPVLTTSSGQTLYMFPPDAERHVTCVHLCAASWPPLTAASHTAPQAGPGVQQALLGTDPDPTGGPPVVTYDGWPLYTYQDDVKSGEANGQAVDLDGGYWYVMAPSGQPITVGP